MEQRKIKVLLIIHGLHTGGAENVVKHIVREIDPELFDITVYCTKAIGIVGEELLKDNYRVVLGSNTQKGKIASMIELKRFIGDLNPDVIHSHGTTAILAMGLLCVFSRMPPTAHTFHFGNYPHIRKYYLLEEKLFTVKKHQS